MTRQFPDPGPRTKRVRHPRRMLQEVVPETERRKSHIDLIDPTHPLLPIAIKCLHYDKKDRPSAQDLCHHLAALKETPQYGDSVQQTQERSRAATADKEERDNSGSCNSNKNKFETSSNSYKFLMVKSERRIQ